MTVDTNNATDASNSSGSPFSREFNLKPGGALASNGTLKQRGNATFWLCDSEAAGFPPDLTPADYVIFSAIVDDDVLNADSQRAALESECELVAVEGSACLVCWAARCGCCCCIVIVDADGGKVNT